MFQIHQDIIGLISMLWIAIKSSMLYLYVEKINFIQTPLAVTFKIDQRLTPDFSGSY